MVKIRLQRVGSKHKAKYRVVVAEKTNKRDGKTLATVGFYDPTTDPASLDLKREYLLSASLISVRLPLLILSSPHQKLFGDQQARLAQILNNQFSFRCGILCLR